MKINILKFAVIAILLAIGYFSCTNDPKIESTLSKMETRSIQEKNTDVDFYYMRNEKAYLTIRKDRVAIKASSNTEAEKLSEQDIFFPNEKVGQMNNWVLASVDEKDTDLNTKLKSQGNFDVTYGLEYNEMLCYPTNEIFVLCKRGESPENIVAKIGYTQDIEKIEPMNPMSEVYLVTLNVELDDILRISREMYETGMCEFAEPNFIRQVKPANEHYHHQWNLNNIGQNGYIFGLDINAEMAWAITRGDSNIKVAVLDDGVDLTHPDLQANLLPGYNAASSAPGGTNGGPYMDYTYSTYNAHGTACAGIIGAINNAIGVVGVASGCKIVPVRISWDNSSDDGWYTSDLWIANGIHYAWNIAKVDVISNSWHGGGSVTAVEFVMAMTLGRDNKGCVVVFASGNNDKNSANYPGNFDSRVIVVGAIDGYGERISTPDYSWGSNYGTALDIMAPGINIPTTDIQGLDGRTSTDYRLNFSGTSAAAPHVSGVAALILSINPALTQKQVADIIESTAQKVGGYPYATKPGRPNGIWHEQMGYGLVDAYEALKSLILGDLKITGPGTPPLNTTVTYQFSPSPLPNGVSFDGWTVTPGYYPIGGNPPGQALGTYQLHNGLNNRELSITFESNVTYFLTANFRLPDNSTFSAEKVIDLTIPETPFISANKSQLTQWGESVTFSVFNSVSGVSYEWQNNQITILNHPYTYLILTAPATPPGGISTHAMKSTGFLVRCRALNGQVPSEWSNEILIPFPTTL